MFFGEALRLLVKLGGNVYRPCWPKGKLIFLDSDLINISCGFSDEDMGANDWVHKKDKRLRSPWRPRVK